MNRVKGRDAWPARQVAGVVEVFPFEIFRGELQLNLVVADDTSIHRTSAKV
jgi:hypothetical protein